MRCAPCQAFLVLAVAAFCAGAHAQEPYPDPRAAQARQEGLAIASRVRAQQDLLEAREPVPEPRRPPAPPLTNARRHEMDQCARRAAQGGP